MSSEDNTNRTDPAWKYFRLVDPTNTYKFMCNFCGKITNGGVCRAKKHLVGGYREVLGCPRCPPEVKLEIQEFMGKNKSLKDNTNRTDPAWKYFCLVNPTNTNKFNCNFCGKITNGGVCRAKKHLVGGYKDVVGCPRCPPEVKLEIQEFMVKKKTLKDQMQMIPDFDDNGLEDDEDDFMEIASARGKSIGSSQGSVSKPKPKKPKTKGPINIPPGFGANQLPNFSGDSAKVSPLRQNNSHGGATHKRKGVPFVDLDPQQPVLSVAPLNSVPYTGPPLSPVQRETDPTVSNEPALVFLPSRPYEEEWNNIITATKRGVGLTGSAARGKVGAIIGLMNIGEGEETYLFRVSLPGVAADKSTFSCDIEPTGKVVIKGITATGERIVRRHSQVFEMCTRNLCPPGHFSISFELPGPVDEQRRTLSFGVDGILEGSVKKRALDGS